jgi:hypothetical protein
MRRFLAVLVAAACLATGAMPAAAPAMPPQFEEFNEIGDAFESMGGSSGYSSLWRLHPDRYHQPGVDGEEAAARAMLDIIASRTTCSGGSKPVITVTSPQVWKFTCPPGEEIETNWP